MNGFIVGDDRSQATLFPERLDDFEEGDGPAKKTRRPDAGDTGPKTSGSVKKGMFSKRDFIYHAEDDEYECPDTSI
jgi:hypothetical protein